MLEYVMPNLKFVGMLFVFPIVGCAHVSGRTSGSCDSNSGLQNERSAELLKTAQEDQADRSGPYASIDWDRVNRRDL
jgi:hypothetical protein